MDNPQMICLSLLRNHSMFSYLLFSLDNFFVVICIFFNSKQTDDNNNFRLLTYYKYPLQMNALK